MTRKPYLIYNSLPFFLVASFVSVFPCSQVKAQLTPDKTLGGENSRVRNQPGEKRIEGGAIRGKNLFHSFKQFNVNPNATVNFANPSGVENIFTRVTGGNASQINGVLGVLGNANLFLINPAGISFGRNASLSLSGSFFATTADSVLFENGFAFSASNPTAPPLLTINIPIGLNFRANPGEIKTNGSILTLAPEKNLTLLGGNVSLNGTELNVPGGNIILGGLSAPGEIGLDSQFNPKFPDGITRSDVGVTGGIIKTVGDLGEQKTPNPQNSGNIAITAASVRLTEFAQLDTRTYTQASAGDVNINATGKVVINSGKVYTGGNSNLYFSREGKGGNINIVADSLTLSNQGRLDNNKNANSGDIGSINISTKDVKIFGGTIVSGSQASQVKKINAGNINIFASNSLSLDNGTISYSTKGGKLITGDININVGNSMTMINDSSILNLGILSIPSDNPGSIGGINIQAGSLTIKGSSQNEAFYSILTGGEGTNTKVKDISIKVNGELSINNGYISNFSVLTNEISNSGSIKIEADKITLSRTVIAITNNAQSGTSSLLFIKARNRLKITDKSRISTISNPLTKVYSGNIQLEAKELFLENKSLIQSSTAATSNAGNIYLKVQKGVFIDNSQILADVKSLAIGSGGEIRIESKSISLVNSIISSTTYGLGNGGNILIRVKEAFIIDGLNKFISLISSAVATDAIGNGGLIKIETPLLTINNGAVRVGTLGKGNAGNITIKVTEKLLSNNSRFNSSITSEAIGRGGNINVESKEVVLNNSSFSVSTRGQGNAGKITLKTANLNLNQSILSGITQDNGNAGSIVILDGQNVTLNDHSLISTDVLVGSRGQGGDITISSVDLTLDNQSAINSGTATSNKAGNINLNLNDNLSLNNKSSINVNSSGQGQGGNIEIKSSYLNLDDSKITAQTTLSSGGNISIATKNLSQLSRASQISTTAGTSQGGGDGGNITIESKFLLANPQDNSDITANASFGKGGRIEISSSGIFGFQSRSELTQQSDITAFSQFNPVFNGQIIFNTPESDPSRGLVTLPQEVVDAANLISQNPCERGRESELIITGKGGLSPSPHQANQQQKAQVSWVKPVLNDVTVREVFADGEKVVVNSEAIQPARGWVVNAQGKVELVGYSTSSISRSGEGFVLDFCPQR